MDAINSLPTGIPKISPSKRKHSKIQQRKIKRGDGEIIRHERPRFNKAKILAKIQREQKKKKVEDRSMPDSPLLKNKKDNQEKLKQMLKSPGAVVFNQKEREVLSKILGTS